MLLCSCEHFIYIRTNVRSQFYSCFIVKSLRNSKKYRWNIKNKFCSDNGWNLIRYNGTTGYIHGGNLADSYTAPKAAATTKGYFDNNWSQTAQNMNTSSGSWKTVYVSSGYLALRTAPSYDSGNEIGQLYTGDSVQLTGGAVSGSYVQVYSPKIGSYGWVNAGFLA